MACQRNRILELVDYIESIGIQVNIGKNKARGNKGLFKAYNTNFRIDIAKGQTEETVLKTLVHEFAHYIHYSYDKTLSSLNFIFKNEDLTEELINLTVASIPKESVAPIFQTKNDIQDQIKNITKELKSSYPDLKISEPFNSIEKNIRKTNLKYLLKYDKVKLIEGFSTKLYSIDNIDSSEEIKSYLKLKSLQRYLKRINSRINRLNKYYNSPTELFARALEIYLTNKEECTRKAPNLTKYLDNTTISEVKDLKKIFL